MKINIYTIILLKLKCQVIYYPFQTGNTQRKRVYNHGSRGLFLICFKLGAVLPTPSKKGRKNAETLLQSNLTEILKKCQQITFMTLKSMT